MMSGFRYEFTQRETQVQCKQTRYARFDPTHDDFCELLLSSLLLLWWWFFLYISSCLNDIINKQNMNISEKINDLFHYFVETLVVTVIFVTFIA